MKPTRTALTTAAACLAAAAAIAMTAPQPAAAWDRGPGASPCTGFIEKFDKDGDNRVSADEYPGRPERFQVLDENRDGFVDDAEQPEERRRGRRFNPVARFDTDGDGTLSVHEFPGPDAAFERFDANGDGVVDEAEMPEGPPRGNPMVRFDADGDGKLSAQEFPGSAAHFARLDADGDGFLTEAEMPRHGHRHGRGKRSAW